MADQHVEDWHVEDPLLRSEHAMGLRAWDVFIVL